MRVAARLKLVPSAATSSRPSSDTRWCSAPAPKASTPCFNASKRRVRRRTTGQEPAATARKMINSSSTRPTPSGSQGGRSSAGSSGGSPGGTPAAPGPPARPPGMPRPAFGRVTRRMRPSSSTMVCTRPARAGLSRSRRMKESDAPMRTPWASSSAIGTRRRSDQSRSAAACSAGAVSAAGRARWMRSPQASPRSRTAASTRPRCSSKCRCTSQPEPSANSASAATTVT